MRVAKVRVDILQRGSTQQSNVQLERHWLWRIPSTSLQLAAKPLKPRRLAMSYRAKFDC